MKLSSPLRVVAVNRKERVQDVLVNFFMMRGNIPTHFDFVVEEANDGVVNALKLTVFVTQPTPGAPSLFDQFLNQVGKGLGDEFKKDGLLLHWKRDLTADKDLFVRMLEDIARQGMNGSQMEQELERRSTYFQF